MRFDIFNRRTAVYGIFILRCLASSMVVTGCLERMTLGGPGSIIDADSFEVTPEIRPGLGPLTEPVEAIQSVKFTLKGIDYLEPSADLNMAARFRIRWKVENRMTTAIWLAYGMLVILDESGKEIVQMMWYNNDILAPSACRSGKLYLPYDQWNDNHKWLAKRPKGSSISWQWYEMGIIYSVGLGAMPAFMWNESPKDVIAREGKADVILKENRQEKTLVYNERVMAGFLCNQWFQFHGDALRSVVVRLRNDEYVSKKHQALDFIALRTNLNRIFDLDGLETITWNPERSWKAGRKKKTMSGVVAVLRRFADKVCYTWENDATKAGLCLIKGEKGVLESYLTFTPTADFPLVVKKKKGNTR